MADTTIIGSGARDDLVRAHQAAIAGLAEPGTWWSSAERIAIAAEVRRALTQRQLPPWEAPSQIDGMIGPDHPLPAEAVDAIWRITNHPGSLTRQWYDLVVAGLPSPEHYVELVGVVAVVTGLDRFAEAMGLEVLPLPEVGPGDPSCERVPGAVVSTHWVPTATIRGPNVLKALSAVPADAEVRAALSDAQYVPADALLDDLEWNRGTLDRRQIELLAAQTSLVNECFY